MKQVLQSLRTGETMLADVPLPAVRPGHVLIRTDVTLVSAGTERMLVAFGKANPLEKARQQPDKVRAVIEKVRTDGIAPTLDAVRRKLDEPLPMGYCNVGTIVETGTGVRTFAAGDRVVSNGKHAQYVVVPENLCARIPAGVDDEAAAFTVIGAIALQSIRLAAPTFGEAFAVTGLGIVGLLTVALLRAHGCRVFATDFSEDRVALARRFGAHGLVLGGDADPAAAAFAFSRGRGIDGVIVAAATQSNEPIRQAAAMSRKRGRIVLVGVAGLELSRADFYEKELSFQVSCSYGPGRYDPAYEEGGIDYPAPFVRWTAQRNFEAFLDALDAGGVDPRSLISHRYRFEDATRAYDLLDGNEPSLGILLDTRGTTATLERTIVLDRTRERRASGTATIGFIGSGQYASGTLIPAFRDAGATLRTIAGAGGVSGATSGRKFGFAIATTDTSAVLEDPHIDAVVIATRHDSHASLAERALRAGKSVFVEKPLALTRGQIDAVARAYASCDAASTPILTVGYNRRFAPSVVRIRNLLAGSTEPKTLVMTVNAGDIPREHWTQDPTVGGGRVIGEACHFIDLLRFVTGAPIVATHATSLGRGADRGAPCDKVTIELQFADGSMGTIHYFANGHRSFPKERLEVFAGGKILQLNNFRELIGFGWPKFKRERTAAQDKGHRACAKAFVDALRAGASSPIPFEEIIEVAEATLDAAGIARLDG